MKLLTEQEIIKKGFQNKLQFGTRVQVGDKKGIVNHCSSTMCRVFYGDRVYIEVHPSECKILTPEEAVGV